MELANSFLGEGVGGGDEGGEREEKNVGKKIARGKVQGQTETWLKDISVPVSS